MTSRFLPILAPGVGTEPPPPAHHVGSPAQPADPAASPDQGADRLRRALVSGRTPEFWRTLDELADDPAFREALSREFPSEVEAITDPVARRTFLKMMGGSLALAGMTACTSQPQEKIVPYVRQPEEIVPGRPLYFATAMSLGGVATGLLVESHEGRPTKIEGNPLHPDSLGASDVFAQAAILGLYDPDRSRAVTNLGEIRPWPAFLGAMRAALTAQVPVQGANLRILTESIGSPTLAAQMQDLLTRLPSARWHQWDPASRESARSGARLAFDEQVDAHYRVEEADVILALDSDFLGCGPGSLRYARAFAGRRRPEQPDRMNRLYAIETMPTPTGSRADHRLPARPGDVEGLARQIAAAVGVSGAGGLPGPLSDWARRFADAVAKDLAAHRGTSLVVAGDTQPPVVHALAHAMNESLGNVGRTLVYTDPIEAGAVEQVQSIRELTAAMTAGDVDILVIIGGNPVYTVPPDLRFPEALAKVPLRVHLAPYEDETSELCHWHIPETHFLESWSDARGVDGTVSIVQPLILPLYGGRSAHEVIGAFSETPEKTPYDLVREHWNRQLPDGAATAGGARPATRGPTTPPAAAGGDSQPAPDDAAENAEPSRAFETGWRQWLHDGVIAGTAFAPRAVRVRTGALAAAAAPPAAAGLQIAFRLDPSVLDGRFSNNGWLQELPKPLTKLTWDNAVMMSPATAAALDVTQRPAMRGGEHGQTVTDIVELRVGDRSVRGAAFIVAGHPDETVTVHLGYGRRRGGPLAVGAGFDANSLRTTDRLWYTGGLQVAKTGDRYSLACTQSHHLMEGRSMVRAVTRGELEQNPDAVHEGHHTAPRTLTLVPEDQYDGYKWGMAIDLNACLGCNACVVGCQAENNIPVVGKEQVLRGREMHWLRVDSYYRGELDNPETYFQPVPCMHCENAPCEVVCPVNATVHSHEGLNDMVYNRCVGTRYCSNNCPYKVRRFNYHLYQDWNTPSLKLGRNPDVTVRSRGVMEKCTYCVQRINAAKIESEKENRRVRDQEIQTACQSACPADAIVFGDLNDAGSRVAQLQASQRNYALLDELNTRPRTTYLAAVRNVNPDLEG